MLRPVSVVMLHSIHIDPMKPIMPIRSRSRGGYFDTNRPVSGSIRRGHSARENDPTRLRRSEVPQRLQIHRQDENATIEAEAIYQPKNGSAVKLLFLSTCKLTAGSGERSSQ